MNPSYPPSPGPAPWAHAPPAGPVPALWYGPSDRMPGTPEEVSTAQPEGVSSRLGGRGRTRRRRPVHARQPRHPQTQSGTAVVRRRGGVRRPQDHRRGLPAARGRQRPRQPHGHLGRAAVPRGRTGDPHRRLRRHRQRQGRGAAERLGRRQGTHAGHDHGPRQPGRPPARHAGSRRQRLRRGRHARARGRLHGHGPRAHHHLPLHHRRLVRGARGARVRRRPTRPTTCTPSSRCATWPSATATASA